MLQYVRKYNNYIKYGMQISTLIFRAFDAAGKRRQWPSSFAVAPHFSF